jgi:CubicO group peptidase (beta-lactamase class C family)
MDFAKPEEMGFDAQRLAKIDAFLKERYLGEGLIHGCQVLVAREGRVVHFSTLGAARADGTALGDDAIFRIASMTKPLTSVAFMSLFEEGRVTLDQPVHSVLPELEGLGVYEGGGAGVPFRARPVDRPMQMIDLLRHTSGLTYSFQQRTNVDAAYREGRLETWHGNLDLNGLVAALGQIPLEFSPGTAWNYSVSTDVLGLVVERIAQKPLGQFFEERIIGPLGMADTAFWVPPEKLSRLGDAWAFDPRHKTRLHDRADKSAWSHPPRLMSGVRVVLKTIAD